MFARESLRTAGNFEGNTELHSSMTELLMSENYDMVETALQIIVEYHESLAKRGRRADDLEDWEKIGERES